MKVCPKNLSHKEFITTAHEQHVWKVDGEGKFIEDLACLGVSSKPHPDNLWDCAVCGAPAVEG